MTTTHTNITISSIYNHISIGDTEEVNFQNTTFTFTKRNGDKLYPDLIVECNGEEKGKLVVADDFAEKFLFKEFETLFNIKISTLEQIYGLSLLKQWNNNI